MNEKLLIVADLGLLRAYHVEFRREVSESPRIKLQEEVVLEEAHQRIGEQTTDMAGRRSAPMQKGGASPIADRHNLELETRRRLIKKITSKIDSLITANGQSGCWLATHKEILKSIMEGLSQQARRQIEKQIARDLTKLEPKDLLDHFNRET